LQSTAAPSSLAAYAFLYQSPLSVCHRRVRKFPCTRWTRTQPKRIPPLPQCRPPARMTTPSFPRCRHPSPTRCPTRPTPVNSRLRLLTLRLWPLRPPRQPRRRGRAHRRWLDRYFHGGDLSAARQVSRKTRRVAPQCLTSFYPANVLGTSPPVGVPPPHAPMDPFPIISNTLRHSATSSTHPVLVASTPQFQLVLKFTRDNLRNPFPYPHPHFPITTQPSL